MIFIIAAILIINFSTSLYAIDGKWIFNNIFVQIIAEGGATIDTSDVSFIRSIDFRNIRYRQNDNSRYALMKGVIEILDPITDNFIEYECHYIDLNKVITLSVPKISGLELSIYIKNISSVRKYYSIAISSKNDNIFMNFIGIMQRK